MTAVDSIVVTAAFLLAAVLTLYTWRVVERSLGRRLLRKRLRAERDETILPLNSIFWNRFAQSVLVPLGRPALPKSARDMEEIRKTILRAGYRYSDLPAAEVYFGLRVALALGLATIFLVPMLVDGGGNAKELLRLFFPLALGYYLPSAMLRYQAMVRVRRIGRELPDVLDLLKITLEAGLSLDSALHRVGRELHGIAPLLSKELNQYFLESQSGLPRAQVLTNLAERNQVNALTGVTNVLAQSTRLGTDIAQALDVYSRSLRTERIQSAEEQGARVAAKLTFPLVFLIIPAVLIVILGPAVINMFDRLGGVF